MLHYVEGYPGKITVIISMHKFHDFDDIFSFPDLENITVKFHDFSRFYMTVGALYLASVFSLLILVLVYNNKRVPHWLYFSDFHPQATSTSFIQFMFMFKNYLISCTVLAEMADTYIQYARFF